MEKLNKHWGVLLVNLPNWRRHKLIDCPPVGDDSLPRPHLVPLTKEATEFLFKLLHGILRKPLTVGELLFQGEWILALRFLPKTEREVRKQNSYFDQCVEENCAKEKN